MSYQTVVIPEELAHRLRQVFHLSKLPRTLGDLAVPVKTDLGPFTAGAAAGLISAVSTRHQVCIGDETFYTHCVMDAFILPVLRGQSVEIDSSDPETGEQVRVRVAPQGLDEDSAVLVEATVSFGVTREGAGLVYTEACPFINIFASRTNYENWTRAHPEALTLALTLDDAVALARAWATADNRCCQ
jgi:alkylmercury lyase-like protein